VDFFVFNQQGLRPLLLEIDMTYSIDRSSVADRWDAISYEAQLLLLDKHNLLGGCVVSRDITKEMVELGENLDKIVIGKIPLPDYLEVLI
jgi:hypothetical protein